MVALETLSNNQILNFALENGIIDIDTIQKQIEMNERKKYLEMHNWDIWLASDGRYKTYIFQEGQRRIVAKKDRKSVEDVIVDYYKSVESEPTLNEAFYLWAKKKLEFGEMQKQTYDRYERDFKRFFNGNKLLETKIKYISEDDLEDYIRRTIHEMQLSAKAWGNLRTLLNGIFKYSKKRGYSNVNISNFMSELELSKKIFTKKEVGEFDEVFTQLELDKLIEYLKSKPNLNHLGILMAIYTGMRVGEIAGLKRCDLFEDYIYVHRTQIRYKDENGNEVYDVRDCPKTEAGVRKVVITDALEPIIKQLKLRSFGNEFLFCENGKLKTIHCFTMALYAACDKVGIPRRSMHVLRKTYATRLINAGVDEAIIINLMGHTEISTTRNYYYYNDKLLPQIKEKVNKAIDF